MLHKIIITILTIIIITKIVYFIDIVHTELQMPALPVFTEQEMQAICKLEAI